LRNHIEDNSQSIKSKCDRSLPLFLADAVSDLRLSPSFIEVLIRHELSCKAHIELKWDQELNNSSVIIHHREKDQLVAFSYPIDIHGNNVPELEQIWLTMSLDIRQNFVREYLEIPNGLLQRLKRIPLEFHLWLMVVHYWYTKCRLSPVYLYAMFVCLIKYGFLRNDHNSEFLKEQFDALLGAFDTQKSRQPIDLSIYEASFEIFEGISQKDSKKANFNRRTIYELNCLQAIYKYALRLNEFFNKPFLCSIHPQYFISGSLFYGFVKHCQTKQHVNNMADFIHTLFGNGYVLVDFLHNLFNLITPVDLGNGT
jgi:hypothetical protein